MALVALAGCVIVTGCGDDDDEGSSGQSAKPGSLAVKATGPKGAAQFTVPKKAPAGAVTVEFTNNAKEPLDSQLVKVEGEHSYDEVAAELGKAVRGKAVADWFVAAGGVATVEPGKTGSVTQDFEPGTYYVLGGNKAPKSPARFDVASGEGSTLPETDGTVVATEYKFTGDGLKAGKGKVELRNDGGNWHHFLAAPLKKGATIAQAKKYLQTEKGAPPFSEENGVETTVMNPGVAQVVDVELKPGRYAFFCFVADREGGPPHVQKGMVSEVKVEK
jgi:uncharacterized cupredoxin-like copper-binding protein